VRKPLATLAAIAAAVPLAIALMGSDHKDGPNATADHAADIADNYAWHDGGFLIDALTFAGLTGSGAEPAFYDPDVLYTINIATSATNAFPTTPDFSIMIRFGQSKHGNWGVQVEGMPGTSGAISGAVETVISDGNRLVFAGRRDDPFFFDLDGFKATLQTGTLHFDHTHDTFAGHNVTAVVLKMNLADVTDGGAKPKLAIWVTSARKPQANASLERTHGDEPVLAQR
jgi:hypothetical protein